MTRYIYEIARKPNGSRFLLTVIDSITLRAHACNKLHEEECFQDACDELRKTFDKPDMRFAEVVDGEVVSFNLPTQF